MRFALLLVLVCAGLLFAASTAPPGFGLTPQDTSLIKTYANHDISGGLAAYAAPEVRPGNTNSGAGNFYSALVIFSLIGLGAGSLFLNKGAASRTNAHGRRSVLGVGTGSVLLAS